LGSLSRFTSEAASKATSKKQNQGMVSFAISHGFKKSELPVKGHKGRTKLWQKAHPSTPVPDHIVATLSAKSCGDVRGGHDIPTLGETKTGFLAWVASEKPHLLLCEVETALKTLNPKSGCLFTPACMPEHQPIETCWGVAKNHCRNECNESTTFQQAIRMLQCAWHGNLYEGGSHKPANVEGMWRRSIAYANKRIAHFESLGMLEGRIDYDAPEANSVRFLPGHGPLTESELISMGVSGAPGPADDGVDAVGGGTDGDEEEEEECAAEDDGTTISEDQMEQEIELEEDDWGDEAGVLDLDAMGGCGNQWSIESRQPEPTLPDVEWSSSGRRAWTLPEQGRAGHESQQARQPEPREVPARARTLTPAAAHPAAHPAAGVMLQCPPRSDAAGQGRSEKTLSSSTVSKLHRSCNNRCGVDFQCDHNPRHPGAHSTTHNRRCRAPWLRPNDADVISNRIETPTCEMKNEARTR
jgi:hypothetical protein